MEKVLFVLLPNFADREPVILAEALNWGFHMWESKFEVKTVGLSTEPIKSLGGFTVLPDYSINDVPDSFSALILIGGTEWNSNEAQKVLPLIERAKQKNRLIGAICDASRFLAVNGYVNSVEHTSNDLESIKKTPSNKYTGENYYRQKQSVRDGNFVTANGTAFVEFARDVLLGLEAAPSEKINELFRLCKEGFCPD